VIEMNNKKAKRRRVIAMLSREEMEYLDRLGLDSVFSTGSKLSRVDVIGALVDAAMALGISAQGVRNKHELIQNIINAARSQDDRRKYPRLKKDLIVGFRRADSMAKYEGGAVDDISMGGFRIDVAFLGKPLQVDQVIEITISESQGNGKSITAIGRVAWVKQKGDAHAHEIGVMLTYIKKEDKGRFMKYLSEGIEERETN
jgi:hypothetical protein